MPSAIALQNIFPGAAVAQNGDTASLAGSGLLASHVALVGGPVRGVVSMLNNGPIFLNDWSLATGSKHLQVGATYFVGLSGKLSTSGAQPVGIATTQNILNVAIQASQAQSGASSSTTQSLQTQITAVAGDVTTLFAAIATLKKYNGRDLILCSGFTPAGTGADVREILIPFQTDGVTGITWKYVRTNFRVGTAGGAPSIKTQKSTVATAFSPTDIDTVTLGSGANEGSSNPVGQTVNSGDKIRFNVLTLATAQNWTISVELSPQ